MDNVLYIHANDKIFVQKKLDFPGRTKESSIPLASVEGNMCIALGKKVATVMKPYRK